MRLVIVLLVCIMLMPAVVHAGVTCWTENAAKTITTVTSAPKDAATELTLVAPINGVASGQIVVAATEPLTAVTAACSELKSANATLPATILRVRYLTYQPLVPLELLVGVKSKPNAPKPFYAINDTFLPGGDSLQPVYITATVPVNANPGVYKGSVNIATNAGDLVVPIQVTVPDFVLPDSSALNIWLSPSYSPTQLAYFYQVPHYSEAHWEKIEQQLKLIGGLGNHVLYIPVLWHVNNGFGPQMVAFRDVDGKLVPDFKQLDRYMALVRKYLGPQRLVILGVWGGWIREDSTSTRFPGNELYVTKVDAAGGYTMQKMSADYAANTELWKAVFDGVAVRVKTQLDVPAAKIILGNGDDRHPSDAIDAAWQKIAPESPGWASWTHNYGGTGPRPVYFEIVDAGSGKDAPGPGQPVTRGGWDALNGKTLFMCTARDEHRDGVPPSMYFTLPDVTVGRQKCGTAVGLARIGLDYWMKRIPSETGGVSTLENGFHGGPRTDPGRVDRSRTTTLTVPGPHGPVPMIQYEALREGIQAAEARILVEKAVAAKVGDAKYYTDALTAYRNDGLHLDAFYGYDGNADIFEALGGWQKGAQAIYEAAGEAQKQLNTREGALKSATDGHARRQN
ncbi:MAG: glycoside hydrolase domain-containing protein [bacterium]